MLYDPKWEVPAETKPQEPWRNILLGAAELIENAGHCIGMLGSPKFGYCLLGAVAMVDTGTISAPLSDAGVQAVNRLVDRTGPNIGVWNDRHSKLEAIKILRDVAAN